MQIVKSNTATFVRFALFDSTGSPVNSLASGSVTVEYAQPGATSLTAAAKTSFAFVGKGIYQVQLNAGEIGTTKGHFIYVANGSTALQFNGELQVSDNLLDDLASTLATISTNVTTLINRIGAWTGTGVNTVLGAFQAALRKVGVAAPSDINADLGSGAGTFDPTTDALEAIRDSAGGGGATAAQIWDEVLTSHVVAGSAAEHLKSLRSGNVQTEFTLSVAVNGTRKVAVGVLDRMTVKVKADEATDWTVPISSKTVYFWYANLGDQNPIRVGGPT